MMEPNLKNCFLCFNHNDVQHEVAVSGRGKRKKGDNIKEKDGDGSISVDSQSGIIFLLNELLEIPDSIYSKFFQEYGNPCSWIYCCSSCLVLVDEARNVFDEIALLQKKFEYLQMKLKNEIVTSNKSKENAVDDEAENRPSEILRTHVTKEYSSNVNAIELPIIIGHAETVSVKTELDSLDGSPQNSCSDSENNDDDENNVGTSCCKMNLNEDCLTVNKEVEEFIEQVDELEDCNGGLYMCKTCGRKCNGRNGLVRHNLIHTGENRLYDCMVCALRFSQERILQMHEKIHKEENQFVCWFCCQEFPNLNVLKTHVKTHTGEKPFLCTVCDYNYKSYPRFRAHLRLHINNKIPLYKCETCNKRFRDSQKLTEHMKQHSAHNPESCNNCSEMFKRKRRLMENRDAHLAAERLYKCQFCVRSFDQSGHLTRHINTKHKDFARFSCSICERKFPHKVSLYAHLLTHPEHRFSCKVCGNKYKNINSLIRHQSTHSGQAS